MVKRKSNKHNSFCKWSNIIFRNELLDLIEEGGKFHKIHMFLFHFLKTKPKIYDRLSSLVNTNFQLPCFGLVANFHNNSNIFRIIIIIIKKKYVAHNIYIYIYIHTHLLFITTENILKLVLFDTSLNTYFFVCK